MSVHISRIPANEQNYEKKPMHCRPQGENTISYIAGVETMANYEEVLHLIRYRNWNSVALFDRKFKVLCSELNGRYNSNEFQVEVRKHD